MTDISEIYAESPEKEGPLRCVLFWWFKKAPDFVPQGTYYTTDLSDSASLRLQTWILANLDCCNFSAAFTGSGTMDCIDLMIQEAVSNGNIPGPEEKQPPFTEIEL